MTSILSQLQVIFEQVCSLPTGAELSALVTEYARLAEELKTSNDVRQLASAELRAIYHYVHNIRVLAKAAVNREALSRSSWESAELELQECLKPRNTSTTVNPHAGHSDEDALNYDTWRQWYSDHITHPYYDSRERDWLLKQIPSMTPQKMQTWFVNVRRRSGWSELYKRFADNKRENMEAIFAGCDDPDPSISSKVDPEARKLVARIRQYLTLESKKTEVAPWLNELLVNYKNKATTTATVKKESSSASIASSQDAPPITSSSTGKLPRRRTQKRKASDEKTNITTPPKRSKPSLYTTPHHPTPSSTPFSNSSLNAATATPFATTESLSPLQRKSSSPDLRTSSPAVSFEEQGRGSKASSASPSEQYIIPPFNAWTPPTHAQQQQQQAQQAYVQQQSAFVPAQALQHQHLPMYAALSPQHHAQSFTANNNITYNITPPQLYAYATQQQQQPIQAAVPVAVATQAWTQQPQQWSYVPVQAATYQISPTMTSYPSSSYAMLSNLANTHPGKRKYIPEDDEMPPTPTGSFKRGRTSMSYANYGDQSMAECYVESNFGENSHQGIPLEPYIYNATHSFNPEVYGYTA